MTQIDVFLENGSKDFRNFCAKSQGTKIREKLRKPIWPENSGSPEFGPDDPFRDRKIELFQTQACDPSLEIVGLQDHEKNIFGQIWLFGSKFGPKRVIFGQNFQKNEKFSKIFFFDLNDSESKKGQKNDENFFSLVNWSDTQSFLAKK